MKVTDRRIGGDFHRKFYFYTELLVFDNFSFFLASKINPKRYPLTGENNIFENFRCDRWKWEFPEQWSHSIALEISLASFCEETGGGWVENSGVCKPRMQYCSVGSERAENTTTEAIAKSWPWSWNWRTLGEARGKNLKSAETCFNFTETCPSIWLGFFCLTL